MRVTDQILSVKTELSFILPGQEPIKTLEISRVITGQYGFIQALFVQ